MFPEKSLYQLDETCTYGEAYSREDCSTENLTVQDDAVERGPLSIVSNDSELRKTRLQ